METVLKSQTEFRVADGLKGEKYDPKNEHLYTPMNGLLDVRHDVANRLAALSLAGGLAEKQVYQGQQAYAFEGAFITTEDLHAIQDTLKSMADDKVNFGIPEHVVQNVRDPDYYQPLKLFVSDESHSDPKGTQKRTLTPEQVRTFKDRTKDISDLWTTAAQAAHKTTTRYFTVQVPETPETSIRSIQTKITTLDNRHQQSLERLNRTLETVKGDRETLATIASMGQKGTGFDMFLKESNAQHDRTTQEAGAIYIQDSIGVYRQKKDAYESLALLYDQTGQKNLAQQARRQAADLSHSLEELAREMKQKAPTAPAPAPRRQPALTTR
jgi:hypothetical protein